MQMTTQNWLETREVLLEGLTGKHRDVTAALLENERKYLTETAAAGVTATGNFARFDKVVMPLVRRVAPATIAMELVGTQPMTGPVGIVNSLRVRYAQTVASGGPTANAEASGTVVYDKYSLIAAGEAYTASDARTAAQITAALEAQGGYEMNLEVVKKTIEAKTRKLQAKWTTEAAQDAQALHGLDIEQELVAALSDEIVRELDRELITAITNLAGTVKSFDFALADGRYASEKFASIAIGMSDLSNQIAVKTKRGGATWAVISPNVLVALRHANNGAFVPANGNAGLTPSSTLFVGTLNGVMKVFVDIYATTETILLGYKGASELDTGLVYSPYVPVMQSGVVTDPTSFDPRISLMTSYALTSFTDSSTDLANSANYYARGTVSNLTLGF
jgi:creatinine amidohydrolase/Fe(II)-dependent formamide hydrolase-like protein